MLHKKENDIGPAQGWVAGLRQFVRQSAVLEYCELCHSEIYLGHAHLVEPSSRRLLCCCGACAVLFSNHQSAKYRRVPEQGAFLTEFRMTDLQWEALRIPINLAFFFRSSAAQRVLGFYPSPAGATESLLSLAAWESLVEDNPLLAEFQPDVEALLINRMESEREYYRAPIDRCYELVGIIRANWRGMSGGSEAWSAIRGFFAGLKAASGTLGFRRNA
jgi:hypothetical protein